MPKGRGVITFKRQTSSKHLIGDDGQRILITCRALALTPPLFRRFIRRRSALRCHNKAQIIHCGANLGSQSKVKNVCMSVGSHYDIPGFDVTMQNMLRMCIIQCRCNVPQNDNCLIPKPSWFMTTDPRRQVLTLHHIHYKIIESSTPVAFKRSNADDRRMPQRADHLKVCTNTFHLITIMRDIRWYALHRNSYTTRSIKTMINNPHSSLSQLPLDNISTKYFVTNAKLPFCVGVQFILLFPQGHVQINGIINVFHLFQTPIKYRVNFTKSLPSG